MMERWDICLYDIGMICYINIYICIYIYIYIYGIKWISDNGKVMDMWNDTKMICMYNRYWVDRML